MDWPTSPKYGRRGSTIRGFDGLSAKQSQKESRRYAYEFPKAGAPWPMKKTGTVTARSMAEARRKLVKSGILEPFESRVAKITPVKPRRED